MIEKSPRRAIFYHYYEANETYRDNLIFFLASIWETDADVFLILSSPCTVTIPENKNLSIIDAPNINHDYGGYCYAIAQHDRTFFSQYEQFIFVNSSVRGPFIPDYVNESWENVFTRSLVGNTHLVGATHCVLPQESEIGQYFKESFGVTDPFPHVQTTAYAMTGEAFATLMNTGFYEQSTALSKPDVIVQYELGLTKGIQDKGWDVESILAGQNIDRLGQSPEYKNFSAVAGDPQFPSAYFGRTFHPEEAIFIKTNRNLMSICDLAAITFNRLTKIQNNSVKTWSEATHLHKRTYITAKEVFGLQRKKDSSLRAKVLRRLSRWAFSLPPKIGN